MDGIFVGFLITVQNFRQFPLVYCLYLICILLDICKALIKHATGWFVGKKCKFVWIVEGLKLKQIVWNFVRQLNTQHIVHPLTQNTIKAFKSHAQTIFSLLDTRPPVCKIWVREIFCIILHYKYPKKLYIYQKLDTNGCFAKLRAISNLFSFFIHPVYNEVCVSKTAVWLSSQLSSC